MYITWLLNSLLAAVSQGPVHQTSYLGPGSLGMSVTKKGTLTDLPSYYFETILHLGALFKPQQLELETYKISQCFSIFKITLLSIR